MMDVFNDRILLIYQTSPMYINTGHLAKPLPRPSSIFAMKMCQISFALYIIIQAIVNGIFTIIIPRFRPIESVQKRANKWIIYDQMVLGLPRYDSPVIKADKTLPIGWQTWILLPIVVNVNFYKIKNQISSLKI